MVGSPTVGRRRCPPGCRRARRESAGWTTRAGWKAAASRPPLTADRWRRTQLISEMVAPLLSSAREMACLSCSIMLSPGSGRRGRAAAGDEADHRQIVGGRLAAHVEHAARRGAAGAIRHGWAAWTISMRSRHGVAVAGDDEAAELARQWRSRAPGPSRAEALPHDHDGAALLGRFGQEAGQAMLGWAALTAG